MNLLKITSTVGTIFLVWLQFKFKTLNNFNFEFAVINIIMALKRNLQTANTVSMFATTLQEKDLHLTLHLLGRIIALHLMVQYSNIVTVPVT